MSLAMGTVIGRLGESCRKQSTKMTTLKTLTLLVAVLAGGTLLAMAQSGLPTGSQSPVAGGANGGAYGYGYGYRPFRNLYAYYPSYRRYRHWHY
jgi:hypothetical protein